MRRGIFPLLLLASALLTGGADAQLPVEVFAGHKKAAFDAMFFRVFKDHTGGNTPFVFFSRTRSTIDYGMTATSNLPAFGLTEAVSYNPPGLHGFAPVAVVQLLNKGVYPKAGIQLYHAGSNSTFFSWLVSETLRRPVVDYFLMARYTPEAAGQQWFLQAEAFSAFPTSGGGPLTFYQRARIGISLGGAQFGAGVDFTQAGRGTYVTTTNYGGFIRYDFR